MVKARSLAIGVLVVAAAGALIGWWHPWSPQKVASGHVAPSRHRIHASTAAAATVSVTWAQARAGAPTLARIPGWLPSGVTQQSLYRDQRGTLNAYYSGANFAWTVNVTETLGAVVTVAPNQIKGTVGGIPALIAQWQAGAGGAHLANVAFQIGGNSYDVNGINVPLPVIEHVAASLINP
jgi:uncharacterized protein (DUF2342 family)